MTAAKLPPHRRNSRAADVLKGAREEAETVSMTRNAALRVPRWLPIVLVALAAALAPPAPARAAPGMEVALQDQSVFLRSGWSLGEGFRLEDRWLPYDRERGFLQARALGVSWMRLTVVWATAAGDQAELTSPPAERRFDFSAYDAAVDDAIAHGLEVQLTLHGRAPAYATADRRVGVLRPDAGEYGRFVKAAVAHFGSRVRRYSIWNEPNWFTSLEPMKDSARLYRRLYLSGYEAAKSVDPGVQVLLGETAPYHQRRKSVAPLKWLRSMLCADARYRPVRRRGCQPVAADGYAHHPYDLRTPIKGPAARRPGADDVTLAELPRLTAALDRLHRAKVLRTPGGRRLDLYLTEYGYLASSHRSPGERRRAIYLPRAFALAQRNPRVRQLLQYLLVNGPPTAPGAHFNTGIHEPYTGNPTRTSRALGAWAQRALTRGQIARPGDPR